MIDVAWDMGVGRGGQAVLGLISYSVLTGVIRSIMVETPVHYQTFRTITLQNNSITGLGSLAKGVWVARSPRLKFAAIWMLIAGSFVLLTPTWISAMTGYTAAVRPMTSNGNGDRTLSKNFVPVLYQVQDGARIFGDFVNQTTIAVPWSQGYLEPFHLESDAQNNCSSTDVRGISRSDGYGQITWRDDTILECKRLWAVSQYVEQYGLLGKTLQNTTFQRPDETNMTTAVPLGSPALNVSAYFAIPNDQTRTSQQLHRNEGFYWNQEQAGRFWQDSDMSTTAGDVANPLFWDRESDTTYNLTEFISNTLCQVEGVVEYRWGFSFILLFAYIVTLLLWSFGMWAFYLDQKTQTPPMLAKRDSGIERAILDAAQAMTETINMAATRLDGNTAIKASISDVKLSYQDMCDLAATSQDKQRDGFKQWLKDEVWWLTALCICIILFSVGLAGYLARVSEQSWLSSIARMWSPFSALAIIGILLVLAAGRDVRSRWVLVVPFWSVFIGFNASWCFAAPLRWKT